MQTDAGLTVPRSKCGPIRLGKTPTFKRWGRLLTKKWIDSDLVKRSELASKYRRAPPDYKELLNRKLVSVDLFKAHAKHTHPLAGALRTATAAAMEDVIVSAGFTPYSVSMSKRDKYDGCRYYYMAKDLDKTFRNDVLTDEHVLMFVDVDYYCDINAYLRFGLPMLVYTFVPTEAAGQALDCRYHFVDNQVHYSVSGGATYIHPLWKYEGDSILVRGIHGNMILYNIEQHVLSADPTRRVVGFYPTAYFPRHTCSQRADPPIGRFKPCNGGATTVRNVVAGTVSIAPPLGTNSVTIPEMVFDALRTRRKYSKNPAICDVERILVSQRIEQAPLFAPLLFDVLESIGGDTVINTSTIPVHGFQTVEGLVHEDGKVVGMATTPPIVTAPAVVPVKSYNNDVATIAGRVTACVNTAKTPIGWQGYDNELLQFLIPVPGLGTPITVEEVNAKQTKPAQKGRAEIVAPSLTNGYKNNVKAFIKAEAYNAPTDPRNISTVDTAHQILYSTFTYPFKDTVLKPNPWFASSMTPSEIVARVKHMMSYPDGVIVSDYSRLDGHISDDDKRFKEKAYMRWCHPSYKAQLMEILRKDRPAKGSTANGVVYKPGTSQLSGSPGTTNDNNLVTLRHDYIGLRQLGQTPKMAWKNLNNWVLGASDDRIRANIPGYARVLEEVAAKLGHKLKSDVLHPLDGDLVTFLGRVYVNPCDDTTMQDPLRTLPKLHLSMAPSGTSIEQAAFNRATGYMVTDSETPIIGAYCRAVLRILNVTHPNLVYKSGVEDYRVSQGPYPQNNVEGLLSAMCKLLDLSTDDISAIESGLNAATTLDEIGNIKWDNTHLFKPKVTSVVAGEILHPDLPPSDLQCPSPVTITETCVQPETPGTPSLVDISDKPCKAQLPGTNTSINTKRIPPPLTKKKSRKPLKPSKKSSGRTVVVTAEVHSAPAPIITPSLQNDPQKDECPSQQQPPKPPARQKGKRSRRSPQAPAERHGDI
nr:MAG: RNA-dependent RNA polymerase [Chemarfal virus 49]